MFNEIQAWEELKITPDHLFYDGINFFLTELMFDSFMLAAYFYNHDYYWELLVMEHKPCYVKDYTDIYTHKLVRIPKWILPRYRLYLYQYGMEHREVHYWISSFVLTWIPEAMREYMQSDHCHFFWGLYTDYTYRLCWYKIEKANRFLDLYWEYFGNKPPHMWGNHFDWSNEKEVFFEDPYHYEINPAPSYEEYDWQEYLAGNLQTVKRPLLWYGVTCFDVDFK